MQYLRLLVIFQFFLVHQLCAQSLGNYPVSNTRSGRSITVSPTSAPSNTVGIVVTTNPLFQGLLTGNPVTGKIRVINPKPAGIYSVKIIAYNAAGSSTTKTFILTVTEPDCSVGDLSAGTVVQTGLNQVMAVIGDFNSDGNQDIAAAHEGGNNTLSIRMGNGNGTFSGTMELPVGSHPYNVAIGDVTRDGIEDLVTVNSGDNSITPIIGNGNGTFQVKPVADVGTSPISIVIGDFDSDGRPDVATANLNSNTISIRQGNAAGFFYGNTEIPVGANPYHIALGDFNNDGKQDLATANSSDNTVSIRLSNGNLTFTNAPDVPVGQNPLCVAIGDFNEDGNEDIATANYVINTISIRLGDGHGNFSGNVEIPTGVGAYYVAVGNFNGDVHKDLAVVNYFDNSISVRFGNGRGGFVNGNDVQVGSYPTWVTVGEFNQDHFMDAIVSNFQDGAVSVHLGLQGFPPIDSVRSNSPVCEEMTLELHAYGGVNYSWVGPTGFSSNMGYTLRLNMTVADTGNYQVTIEDSGRCVAVENVHVTVWPSPIAAFHLAMDTVCSGTPIFQLQGGIPAGGLYTGTGVFNDIFFDPQFTGPGEFDVTYVFFDEHDCTASDSEKIWVIVCAGTDDIPGEQLNVYPIPATEELTVIQNDDAEVLLYNVEGMLVRKWHTHQRETKLSIAGLPAGMYTLKSRSDDKLLVRRIIKNQ